MAKFQDRVSLDNPFLADVPDASDASAWVRTVARVMRHAADAINRVTFQRTARAYAFAHADGLQFTLRLLRQDMRGPVPGTICDVFDVLVRAVGEASVLRVLVPSPEVSEFDQEVGLVCVGEEALVAGIRDVLARKSVREAITSYALGARVPEGG